MNAHPTTPAQAACAKCEKAPAAPGDTCCRLCRSIANQEAREYRAGWNNHNFGFGRQI